MFLALTTLLWCHHSVWDKMDISSLMSLRPHRMPPLSADKGALDSHLEQMHSHVPEVLSVPPHERGSCSFLGIWIWWSQKLVILVFQKLERTLQRWQYSLYLINIKEYIRLSCEHPTTLGAWQSSHLQGVDIYRLCKDQQNKAQTQLINVITFHFIISYNNKLKLGKRYHTKGDMGVYGTEVLSFFFKCYFGNFDFNVQYCGIIWPAVYGFSSFWLTVLVKEDPSRYCSTIYLRSPV